MRAFLGFIAILLTASTGIPSAPAEMSAHCARHTKADGDHHGSAPDHQHQDHSDSHCPAHSCPSSAPCTTGAALLQSDDRSELSAAQGRSPAPLTATRFSSRDTRPTHPPPRRRSA